MKRVSTIFYAINMFVNGKESELIDLDALLCTESVNKGYADVYKFLDKTIAKPSPRVVNKILEFAKSKRK